MPNQIRPLAICIFRDRDRILVGEGYDPLKREVFYRPLGGGIEFGERAEDALRREMREELGAEIESPRYLFTLENIFAFNGEVGHEIVLVFDARLSDANLYLQETIAGVEFDGTQRLPFNALWKNLDEFGVRAPLYPDGLLDALRSNKTC
ncbi:MAG: hypothetical protein HFACDABA_00965 [Anaerolineales bacterium]|nr:hypothetical protein [Anaerolineales bacterium]